MKRLLLATALSGLLLGPAKADVVTLNIVDTALLPFAGIEDDTVTINRLDATHATFTFNAVPNAGLDFLFLGAGSLALNVNAASFALLGSVSFTQLPGFAAASVQSIGSGQVNGFGNFNFVVNAFNGYEHATTSETIELVDLSGTWASALDVLTPNSHGFDLAAHVGVCVAPCTVAEGAMVTGFVAGTLQASEVPEPSSFSLFGVGLALLLGMGTILRGMSRYPL